MGLTPHHHLVPKVLENSRATPLLTLRVCVAYTKGENLPTQKASEYEAKSNSSYFTASRNVVILFVFSDTELKLTQLYLHQKKNAIKPKESNGEVHMLGQASVIYKVMRSFS